MHKSSTYSLRAKPLPTALGNNIGQNLVLSLSQAWFTHVVRVEGVSHARDDIILLVLLVVSHSERDVVADEPEGSETRENATRTRRHVYT